jgi:hypothetical protein
LAAVRISGVDMTFLTRFEDNNVKSYRSKVPLALPPHSVILLQTEQFEIHDFEFFQALLLVLLIKWSRNRYIFSNENLSLIPLLKFLIVTVFRAIWVLLGLKFV